jgi:Ca2+-binding EF-hand superfamily protein
MKTTWIISAGLLAAVAFAQQPRFGGEGRRGGGPGSIGFATLDTNGNGTLEAAEIDASQAVLAKLDKNGDGQISAEEVRPAFPEGRGRGGPEFEGRGRRGPETGAPGNVVDEMVKTLMSFDANSGGKLAKSELPERMQGIFDRADDNKDGFLTADEIRKLAAAQAAPTRSEGPNGRGGPGREGPQSRRGEGFGGQMNFIRMDPVLAAVDTNSDGTLSAEEIRSAPKSIRTLDADGDGKITREELMTAMRRRRESENRER